MSQHFRNSSQSHQIFDMMPDRQKPKDLFDMFCSLFLGPAQLQVGVQILITLILYALFQAIWLYLRPFLALQNDYIITPSQIEMRSRPIWISPSLQQGTIKNDTDLGSRNHLSLLDPGVVVDIINAFRADPWVREVNSVLLTYPAQVRIDAEYRQPVAFVEASSSLKEGISSRSVFQVDADGVLLPTDFLAASIATNQNTLHDFIRIIGITSTPVGIYGQQWGDPILDEASLFADFLRSDFKKLGIIIIRFSPEDENTELPMEKRSQQRVWRLETAKGREIIWGAFPMSDVIRARSGTRSNYLTAKAEAFHSLYPKLSLLLNRANGAALDTLPEEDFPIDLSQSD